MNLAMWLTLAAVTGSLVSVWWAHHRALASVPRVDAAPPRNVREAAFLGGGPGRVADTVFCLLLEDGRLRADHGRVTAVEGAHGREPVERELLHLCAADGGSSSWKSLRPRLMSSAPVQRIGDELAERGLLFRPEIHRPWRRATRRHLWICLLGYLCCLILGDVSLLVRLLVLPLAALLLAGLGLLGAPDRRRRTPRGRLETEVLRITKPFAVTGVGAASTAVAVGGLLAVGDAELKGELVQGLAGTELAAAHSTTSAVSGSAEGAWCGGDGGGCSGGCGGCGGCGG
ncbi:TIGR04222 domain-containing membrane protein [Streptomyces sp. NPDC005438]|uniref:TIGR04222 domain-containing membrane protein n=1 Tax=Streptomyces sp. NPDC005438 TaxID=3156880 RepID=UPI00339FF173